MEAALTTPERLNTSVELYGMARLVRIAYQGQSLTPLWQELVARLTANPRDAAALMDMSVILQVNGQREKGLGVQQAALAIERCFRVQHGRGDGPRVLVLMTPGDFMANTPIDFLLETSNATILYYYVDAGAEELSGLPEHDVAFVAIAESEAHRPVLMALERLLRGWPGPIVNNAPERIMALTRDGVARTFAQEPSILAPATIRVYRNTLEAMGEGSIGVKALLPGQDFPLVVRPLGGHAGQGMEKLDDPKQLAAYLEKTAGEDFYLSPFIDYSGPDGLFRKQRIAFIDGAAFASHMATSEHWMVHYLSAGMEERAERREEEAAWMRDFDMDFAVHHAGAFEVLCRGIGLDYFAIDCAELPDGRLLLFEADVAMIVHTLDSAALFPYKVPAMQKLLTAFEAALRRRCKS